LGIDPQFVAGYRGGWKSVMGVVRGEVDLIAYPTDVLKPLVKAGDMRLLLQVSEAPISSDPLLKGVPLLGGGNGLAASRAAALGRDVEEAIADAAALAGLVDGDQLIAAPRGLEEGIFRYLETKLYQALTDPGYKAALDKLGWPLDVARADVALAEVKAAEKSSEKFIPLVREAIKKAQR